jgi:zinc transport system substrate-binding protein
MIRPPSILTLAALFLLALPQAPAFAGEPALSLVVTIHPLEMLLRELTGDRAEIATLVPPGASPHTFEPKPSDLMRVARADGFMRVGAGLDDWSQRILASAGRDVAVHSLSDWLSDTKPTTHFRQADGSTQADGVTQADGSTHADGSRNTGGHDHAGSAGAAHSWLDPILVRDRIVPGMVDALSTIDPTGRPIYQAQGEAFRARLTHLDEEIRETLARAPGREFVAFHNAWRHFAKRYQLRELAVVQEFAGEEPTPRELAMLVQAARDAKLPAILVEPQLDPRLARTIGAEFGARTILVDPLGDASVRDRSSYGAMMRFNAAAFARALGGEERDTERR